MSESKFSNDATTKLLGYDYQKIVALERCLNAKKNDIIWIECKGDVADVDTSIEVKHHIKKNNITNNSEDVWKTIKNYVIEFNVVEQFSSLVLHTTSIAQSDSIFYNWNKLTAIEKQSKLKSHVPSSTVSEFHQIVVKCQDKDLLKILDKFTILEGQLNIKDKWKELEEHSTFTIIPENFRTSALEKLYGYITKKAIDNSNKWQIYINDFNKDIQAFLSPYAKGKTPFPIIDSDKLNLDKREKNFIFIDKMKIINVKDKDQTNAIADYIRANISQIRLLKDTPTLSDNLTVYDENIQRNIEDEKSKNAIGIIREKLNTEEAHNISKKLYFDCISKPHDSIPDVDNTQKYYRDGRIHHIVEGTDFEWKFNQIDL